MATKFCSGVLVLLVLGIWGSAANPQISLLKKQVSALKHEQSSVAKDIRANYTVLTKQKSLDAKGMAQMRAKLAQEEKQLLALTKVKGEKDQIRQKYSALLNSLKQGGKLDKTQIKALRQQEKALLAQVKTLYSAKIQQMEAQIALLKQQESLLPKTKKK